MDAVGCARKGVWCQMGFAGFRSNTPMYDAAISLAPTASRFIKAVHKLRDPLHACGRAIHKGAHLSLIVHS